MIAYTQSMPKLKHKERTLVLIKPDGVQRSLIGEIIKRYERSGLKLAALKFVIPTPRQVRRHYLVDKDWMISCGQKTINAYIKAGKQPLFKDPVKYSQWILDKLQNFLSAGPVVAMVWQGSDAVGIVRKITGGTEPLTSDVGTIRGDFTVDSYALADADSRAVRNLIHAAASPAEAEKEIKVWFKPSEIVKYRLTNEAILYDVNLDGIKE